MMTDGRVLDVGMLHTCSLADKPHLRGHYMNLEKPRLSNDDAAFLIRAQLFKAWLA